MTYHSVLDVEFNIAPYFAPLLIWQRGIVFNKHYAW